MGINQGLMGLDTGLSSLDFFIVNFEPFYGQLNL